MWVPCGPSTLNSSTSLTTNLPPPPRSAALSSRTSSLATSVVCSSLFITLTATSAAPQALLKQRQTVEKVPQPSFPSTRYLDTINSSPAHQGPTWPVQPARRRPPPPGDIHPLRTPPRPP